MVDMGSQTLFYFVLVCALSPASATSLESFISEIDPCEEVCHKTYPLHTYEKSLPGGCCSRGCRLYSILEFLGERDSVGGTLKTCHDNCQEAYPKHAEEMSACLLGCNSQKPFRNNFGQTGFDSKIATDGMLMMPNPFLYMHNIYNGMLSQVKQHVSISWSMFVQDGSGKMVIAKSKPQVFDLDLQGEGQPASLGTSSVMETNIEPAGSVATEMSKHSQLKSATSAQDEFSAAKISPFFGSWDDRNSNDLLTCIARKTGMPRLILTIIMLLSAIALIWLCLSAAVTAPDMRSSQKLSIRSDLDYLQLLPDKGTKGVLPQDVVDARLLPSKLLVEQV
ncbi:unnamed protein product [Candidula unifasciata]|uniref:Transmembrane protein 59 n=1 Tax=Candidula unifasciata TaxID=100452 RepID=A0A8S3ZHL6_9EUPU|nr:unnamed protein product [Candidula unifasciata]